MQKIKIKTGADLRRFRKSLGMSQFEFAKALGFSIRSDGQSEGGYISAMERGRRPVSRLTKILCANLIMLKDSVE